MHAPKLMQALTQVVKPKQVDNPLGPSLGISMACTCTGFPEMVLEGTPMGLHMV